MAGDEGQNVRTGVQWVGMCGDLEGVWRGGKCNIYWMRKFKLKCLKIF